MAGSHPIFARYYRRAAPSLEARGLADARRRLVDGLAGTVVEVGAGYGANFPHFPVTVTRVLAIEPEPYLRGRATETAARSRLTIDVVDGDAAHLPLADNGADAVVFCLVLCSVPDPAAAVAEALRVLRPGGEVRFLEHVQAHEPGRLRRIQTGLDRWLWPRLFGGCHCSRDTAATLIGAGLELVELDRIHIPEGVSTPDSPHILGRAVRPVDSA